MQHLTAREFRTIVCDECLWKTALQRRFFQDANYAEREERIVNFDGNGFPREGIQHRQRTKRPLANRVANKI